MTLTPDNNNNNNNNNNQSWKHSPDSPSCSRPRAQSLAPSSPPSSSHMSLSSLTSGRWRIVGAWSSLRHSLHSTSETPSSSSAAPMPSGIRSRRDSTVEPLTPSRLNPHQRQLQSSTSQLTPRKRVSLFVRRKNRLSFRRAHSELHPPQTFMPSSPRSSQENHHDLHHTNQPTDDDDIVAEICLEDFAEDDAADDSLWDGESVNMDLEMASRHGSRVWIDEDDFKRLLEGEWFDHDDVLLNGVEKDVFDVPDSLLEQWKVDVYHHNSMCGKWQAQALTPELDIRTLTTQFQLAQRNRVSQESECTG